MTQVDADTMTLDQCQNEIAARKMIADGYKVEGGRWWRPRADGKWDMEDSPIAIPVTLDAIAGAMPKGWDIAIEQSSLDDAVHFEASAMDMRREGPNNIKACEAETEILARARLLVKVLRSLNGQ